MRPLCYDDLYLFVYLNFSRELEKDNLKSSIALYIPLEIVV